MKNEEELDELNKIFTNSSRGFFTSKLLDGVWKFFKEKKHSLSENEIVVNRAFFEREYFFSKENLKEVFGTDMILASRVYKEKSIEKFKLFSPDYEAVNYLLKKNSHLMVLVDKMQVYYYLPFSEEQLNDFEVARMELLLSEQIKTMEVQIEELE